MITITVPINIPDDKLRDFKEHLEHLVQYHPEYTWLKFLVEKSHISLVKITTVRRLERSLLSHIQETIREYLSYVP
jgi:hypothetical protein